MGSVDCALLGVQFGFFFSAFLIGFSTLEGWCKCLVFVIWELIIIRVCKRFLSGWACAKSTSRSLGASTSMDSRIIWYFAIL